MTKYTIFWHIGDQPTQEDTMEIDINILPEYCAITDGELEETADHLVRSELFRRYGYNTSRQAVIEQIEKKSYRVRIIHNLGRTRVWRWSTILGRREVEQ